MRWRFICGSKGSASVEIALMLPVVMAVGLLAVDLYKLSYERTKVEKMAGSAAITLSVQQKLGKPGLDGLFDSLVPAKEKERHQMIISNVSLPSKRVWWTLTRGGKEICRENDGAFSDVYQASLPEGEGGNNKPDKDTKSVVIVRVCRDMQGISLTGLLSPEVLQSVSVNRAVKTRIELDEALVKEATGAIKEKNRK